jgi:hypothetical protein
VGTQPYISVRCRSERFANLDQIDKLELFSSVLCFVGKMVRQHSVLGASLEMRSFFLAINERADAKNGVDLSVFAM